MKIKDLTIGTKVFKVELDERFIPNIVGFDIIEIKQTPICIMCKINDERETTLVETEMYKGDELTLCNITNTIYDLYYTDYCDALTNAIKRLECKIKMDTDDIIEAKYIKSDYEIQRRIYKQIKH